MASSELHHSAFRVHPQDNVAVALDDFPAGEQVCVRGGDGLTLRTREKVPRGHKVALADLPESAPIRRYGHVIGLATQPIATGSWVHLHNCRSQWDERSTTFDRDSGAATDTPYD